MIAIRRGQIQCVKDNWIEVWGNVDIYFVQIHLFD